MISSRSVRELQRRRPREAHLPAVCGYEHGAVPDHRRVPDHPAPHAAGHYAAARRADQPLERADRPAGHVVGHALQRSALRLRATDACAASCRACPACASPLPYGGASRQVMVDLDPDALARLRAHRFRGEPPWSVSRISPCRPDRCARVAASCRWRSMPARKPCRRSSISRCASVNGRTVLLRDVANVRDGEAVPTNIARLDGQNAGA